MKHGLIITDEPSGVINVHEYNIKEYSSVEFPVIRRLITATLLAV